MSFKFIKQPKKNYLQNPRDFRLTLHTCIFVYSRNPFLIYAKSFETMYAEVNNIIKKSSHIEIQCCSTHITINTQQHTLS